VRVLLLIVVALTACRRDRPAQPTPPPVVHIRRLSPVIGERFVYSIDQQLKLVLSDGTTTLAAAEATVAEAEETITAVQDQIATERSIRFLAFMHQPLGAEVPIGDAVTGKTFRWPATQVSDAERAALTAYARPDTGAPDLAAYLLTDRDFERGVTIEIPADEPAPFVGGVHDGASITLTEIAGSIARFAIRQVRVLQVRDSRIRITLDGSIEMNIATARVERIAVEGHITQPTGPVQEAHMTSLQTFTYAR
jgi:hypothetical protein